MKHALLVVALAASFAAVAAPTTPASAGRPFQSSLKERYCEKLREGARAYVLFVRRLGPIHGYTYTDFAPAYPGAPVKADCRAGPERAAAVHALLPPAASAAAR